MGIWFGTAKELQWVPEPLAVYPTSKVSWRNMVTFLNGGAAVLESQTQRMELDWSWPVQAAENLSPILTTLSRPGPYYTLDPLAMKTNVVPSYWATPTFDAPSLVPGATVTKTSRNFIPYRGYPIDALKYVVSNVTTTRLAIPVPEGHTLFMGVHGSGTAGWKFEGQAGDGAAVLGSTTTTRTNMSIDGPTLARLEAPAGTVTINGIIGQILPAGETPAPGGFIAGMGNSGLMLKGDYQLTTYSSELPNAQVGLTAGFVEVGAWL